MANSECPGQPLVSVVVPTCNRRDLMRRCLDALARQTYRNFEVIAVDDGSTDGTPAMFEEVKSAHPNLEFTWLLNPANLGANPSRNRGIRAARGDFVAFLDSDCLAEPDWLEGLMRGFTSERVAAVTGRVDDPSPANIYELTFKGTHRLAAAGPAHRLVGGNMCVRRTMLLEHSLHEDLATKARNPDGSPDVSVSDGCDEDGLYLMLRAAGYEQLVVPDAIVWHDHHYDRRSFFRQAYRGGRSAAKLVYKYHLPTRIDMLPFMLAYLALPLILVNRWWWPAPAVFFLGAMAAIIYNDVFRKGKTISETVRSFPVLVAYYHVRLAGYVIESLRLRLTRPGLRRVRLGRGATRR